MSDRIQIGLVTDHPIFRTGLTEALGASRTLAVAAHGRTAEDAFRVASDAALDIILLEIEIAGLGLDAVEAICRMKPRARLVILTAIDDEAAMIDALRFGARGYILKDITGTDLIRAIESVHRGEYYVTPALVSRVLPRLLHRNENMLGNKDLLTSREQQVLSCLSSGLTNREIASRLGLSIKTVKQHVMLLFAKLGVRNRVEATAVLHKANSSRLHAKDHWAH